ncbi:MAG: GntR family transcriptional regulator [Roseimicrobium sp.]
MHTIHPLVLEGTSSSNGSLSGKARVIRGIIHGLLRGRWQGGDRLTEVDAAELLKVSRTPVREALLELASMGIVELRRNCGAILLPFGEQELRNLYAVRTLLEAEAARLAATRMDAADIDKFKRSFTTLRREQRLDTDWQLDRELHAAIAHAADNPRLAGEIARYGDLVQTMREAVGTVLADIHSTSLTDHLRILRCLKQRAPDAAAEAMRRHLAQAAESAVTALKLVSITRQSPGSHDHEHR